MNVNTLFFMDFRTYLCKRSSCRTLAGAEAKRQGAQGKAEDILNAGCTEVCVYSQCLGKEVLRDVKVCFYFGLKDKEMPLSV